MKTLGFCALALWLLAAPATVFAASVEGQVLKGGEGIPNATVSIGSGTTQTDAKGYFVIWVDPGTQEVRVEGKTCTHDPDPFRVKPRGRNWVTITCQ